VGVREGKLVIHVDALANQIGDLVLPHNEQAKGDVGIAVRPEKIRLGLSEPDEQSIRLKMKVTEIVYYGDESHVFLETGDGARFAANLKNDSRDAHTGIQSGEEAWISWCPEDTLVLSS
jgi:ABC-type Fe3+/spermidine/putrescine transport system ATPase subunit